MKRDEKKKYIRYKDGPAIYSISQKKFEQLAKEANATYKVGKAVLVNCEILEQYLEMFHIVENEM